MQRLLYTTALVSVFSVVPAITWAGPENGAVISGSASIAQSGNLTTITQSSNRAIVRWDKFNVSQPERVEFVQPHSTSVTVNRIMDNDPSKIEGSIHANGRIILINPNGILFSASSKVDVAGLVATTSDLDDDNAFMVGGAIKFTKPGNPNAKIINEGEITVKQAGLVGLIAPNVENHGIIQAKLGKVQLASGDIHTIDFAGDGLIKLEVSDAVTSQSIKNTGLIHAEGGAVLITAAQARNAVDALITNTGTIKADTVDQNKGSIKISTKGLDNNATQGKGTIINEGIIQASGDDLNEAGGHITILSDLIAFTGNAELNASGDTDGGIIMVGGAKQGGGGLPTSDQLYVGRDVILNASSRRKGDGGTVILWSDENTRFYGNILARGGNEGGNGGFVEVSGKNRLTYDGFTDLRAPHGKNGVLLLDPTNIQITNTSNQNISGSSPFTSTLDDGPSVLSVATLQTALAAGNVIVQTAAAGSQAGDITIDSAITWAATNTLTLQAHHDIIINSTISGRNLVLTAGNDVQLNAAISGIGTLTIQTLNTNGTIGIGASQTGALNLGASELANISDGWANIIIGSNTKTGITNIGAASWTDNVSFLSGTGAVNINGTQTMGTANTLTVTGAGAAIAIAGVTGTTGALNFTSGGGNITNSGAISTSTATQTYNSGTGSITTTGAITSTSGAASFTTTGGAITIGSAGVSTSGIVLTSGTGVITANGIINAGTAANMTITTDGNIALNVANALSGTGAFVLRQASTNVTMGIGDSQTGTVNLTTAEYGRIATTWTGQTFGLTTSTADINVGAMTFGDPVTIQTGTGAINLNGGISTGANALTVTTAGGNIVTGGLITSVNGNKSFNSGTGNITIGTGGITTTGAGTSTLGLTTTSGVITINNAITNLTGAITITTDADLALNAALSGTGTLRISATTASMGIGTGQTGVVSLTDTELALLGTTFTSRTFGWTTMSGAMNVGANTWADAIVFNTNSGVITIAGNQTMGANALTITTGADLALNADLLSDGTGTLIIQQQGNVATGIGDGTGGVLNLTNAELARISTNWNNVTIGSNSNTAAMNVGAYTWDNNMTFQSAGGVITIAGATMVGTNSLTFNIASNLGITGNLTSQGGGTITILPNGNISFGIGTGAAGTIALTDTELDFIQDGWAGIVIGNTTSTGSYAANAYTWRDNVTLRSAASMSITGLQTVGTNNITISNVTNATSIGSGISSTSGTITLSSTTGAININGPITSTSGNIAITSTTGAINIDGNVTSTSGNLTATSTSGVITVDNAINVGSGSATFTTNGDLTLNNTLAGTGTLTIAPAAAATTVGIGDSQIGDLNLTNAELDRISDGWSSIVLGGAAQTGATNVGAYTWRDNITLRSIGVMTITGLQTVGANNFTLTNTTAATTIANGISSTSGIITLTSTTGAMNVNGAITSGSGNINITATTGGVNITSPITTTSGNLALTTGAGIITINSGSGISVGSGNATITTDGNIVINDSISGTGTLTIQSNAIATVISIGGTQTGLALDDAELGRILAGWSEIVFGRLDGTGAVNVAARTWQYDMRFRSNTGVIRFLGAQNFGGRNLTIESSGNVDMDDPGATLTGTGILTIKNSQAGTAININATTTGLALSTAAGGDLDNIVDGWSQIIIGSSTSGNMLVSVARTWNDNLTLRSGGTITVSALQTMGANTATLETDSDVIFQTAATVLTGSGTLRIRGISDATVIGIGTSQTGTLNLNNSGTNDLSRIASAFSQVEIGRTDATGNINIGAVSLPYRTRFLTRGNINLGGNLTSTVSGGTSLVFYTGAGAFVNGATYTISAGSGGARYLLYSVASGSNTMGGLTGTAVNAKTYFGYGPTSVTETGNVFIYSTGAPKVIYLRADDKVKIYGDAAPAFTYSYIGGLEGSDTLNAAILSALLSATGSLATDSVGTNRTITGTFSMGLSYGFSLIDGTLSVSKAPVTIQAAATSRVYGDANPTFAINYTGLKNGETSNVIDTLATASSGATTTTAVGVYSTTPNFITSSGAIDNNYTFNYATGTLTITAAPITITLDNKTKVYGDANPTLTASYSGFKNSDTSAIITGLITSTTAVTGSNVGSYAITGSGASANSNYTINYVDGSLSVTPAALTITAANKTKVYGEVNPALTVNYSAFKNGDTEAVLSGLAINTAAGQYEDVGSYAIVASGATNSNYTISFVDGSLSITKATLTGTIQNASREYGENNPGFSVVYTGFVGTDDENDINTQATLSTSATNASDVNTYAITATGAADTNYAFNYVNGTLTITKAMITVTADDQTREYGEHNPTLTAAYSGFKLGQGVGVINTQATVSTSATNASNVGHYAINATGADDNNYSFTYVAGDLDITKAMITVTADDQIREYGEHNPTLTATYSGFKLGQGIGAVDTQATVSTSATNASNVGHYAINATGADDTNYAFTYVAGDLDVTKATVTVTVDDQTREYGESNPALTAVYSGFKLGQGIGVINTQATISTSATNASDVNHYAINATGADDNNYDFNYVAGDLNITKAVLTATVQDETREYGEHNSGFNIIYGGFKLSQNHTVINTLATASTSATNASNVGHYAINATGADDNNYDFNYVAGDLDITKATLTATADDKTRVYGNSNPALTVTYTGFKLGQGNGVINALATATTSATNTSNVDHYAINVAGASDNNYDFDYVAGDLDITKAALTATVQNANRVYGDTNPSFNIVYTGFKFGQNSGVIDTLATASTSANTASNVGTYAITGTSGFDNNYSFNYMNGALNVTKSTLTVTANNKSRYYSAVSPTLTATYTGFKNGQNVGVIDTLATLSSSGTNPMAPVGSYNISVNNAFDNNYGFAYVPGSFQVIDDGLAPVVTPNTLPSTVQTPISSNIEKQSSTKTTANSSSNLNAMVYETPKSDTLLLSDIIVLPAGDVYDVDLNKVNFILAITDQLRDAFEPVDQDDSTNE